MVGGWIIEIKPLGGNVYRLWCVDRQGDECAVHVKDNGIIKERGDAFLSEECWWQAGKVMLQHDTLKLEKIGNSYDPRTTP